LAPPPKGIYMTTQMKTGENAVTALCSANDVENYLHTHPEFFVEHPELLTQLEVPHPSGGAVSLIERQVALIRQENKQHRERIRELVEIARDNESIVDKLHQLSIHLIATKTLNSYIGILQQQLRDNFSANHVRIVLFKESFVCPDEQPEFISRTDSGLENFGKFLAHKQAICGRFNTQQLNFLFADNAVEVKSMALIPLVDSDPVGMLAISSANVDHFKAGMSTAFLSSLGDISSAVIKHYLK